MADTVLYSVGAATATGGGLTQVVTEYQHAVVATSTSDSVVTVNPNRIYLVQHNGVDASGDPDTNEVVGSVTRATGGTPATSGTFSAVTNKHMILSGGPVVPIGPGVTAFALKAVSGTPTVSIYASMRLYEGW